MEINLRQPMTTGSRAGTVSIEEDALILRHVLAALTNILCRDAAILYHS
jgi:hypothetical protein